MKAPGKTRKPVLRDHVRDGKKLIPPALQMKTPLTEVDWINQLVPEVVWIGLLRARFGEQRAAALGLALVKAAAAALPPVPSPWFGTVSSFGKLSAPDWERVRVRLSAERSLDEITAGLEPLCVLYPSTPLAPLIDAPDGKVSDEDKAATVAEVLEELFDRRGAESTFVQGTLVYFAYGLGKLKVAPGLQFGNLAALEKYTETEESRVAAGGIRAFVNSMIAHDGAVTAEWTNYFWNRGFEISRCDREDWDE